MKKVIKHNKPLVSVVMPVYNAGKFLVPAIESILNQSLQDCEFIIVDDASTDGSRDVIKRYQKAYPHKITAIFLKNNLNAGGDTCANIGLAAARGTFIARMDADDIARPERLEKQVAFLKTHRDIFLVGTQAEVIDDEGRVIGTKTEPTDPESIRSLFFSVHPLVHPTCMYRKQLPSGEPFRYLIRFNANNDYYTFFTLLAAGIHFANLPETLLSYRVHEKSATFRNLKQNFRNTVAIRLAMIHEYHVSVTLKDLLTMAIQAGIVSLLPQELLTQVYVRLRGFKQQPVSIALPSSLTKPLYKPSHNH